MEICLKKRLFEYLAKYPPDSFGWAYVLASQVSNDTGLSKEELWNVIIGTKKTAFLDYLTTNNPSPQGLISMGISQRGRLWLKGEDYSHIPEGRDKVYNLL